jgi:hypothetical protein
MSSATITRPHARGVPGRSVSAARLAALGPSKRLEEYEAEKSQPSRAVRVGGGVPGGGAFGERRAAVDRPAVGRSRLSNGKSPSLMRRESLGRTHGPPHASRNSGRLVTGKAARG